MSKWKPSQTGSQVQVEAKSKWKPSPSGSQVQAEVRCPGVRCPSEAKPRGSKAKWKLGVKGCEGVGFVKVRECGGGVARKPGVQVLAKSKPKSDVQAEARYSCGS